MSMNQKKAPQEYLNKEQEYAIKLQKLELMEQQLKLKEGLPHLYGLKRYAWQKAFHESRNKKRLLCAANQIGKSTEQIRSRIDVLTNPDIWPELWPKIFEVDPTTKPVGWYLYPNQDTVKSEIETKWIPYYLPRGEYKDHPIYGWQLIKENKVVKYINFNSGGRLYFKTYNQNVHDLQSGTIFSMDLDEETPVELLPELQARLFATDGYLSMAFTATLGQDFWYRVIERQGEFDEMWEDAFKIQVSMYDCLKYEDGEDTPWSIDKIEQIKRNCKNDNEVQRRVYGRFVKDEGLKYPAFSRERNLKPFPKDNGGRLFKGVPSGWSVYSSVDVGGGGTGHPAAYSFLSLSSDCTKIRWFKGRRLDGFETTAADIYKHYKMSRGRMNMTSQSFDFAGKDFGTIANRAGEPFTKAKKDHELGEMALNTALQTGMFVIYYDPEDPADEAMKLVREFETLTVDEAKRNASDDLIDTCRYAVMDMPIDWEAVLNDTVTDKKEIKRDRRGQVYENLWEKDEEQKADMHYIDSEIDEWNDLY